MLRTLGECIACFIMGLIVTALCALAYAASGGY